MFVGELLVKLTLTVVPPGADPGRSERATSVRRESHTITTTINSVARDAPVLLKCILGSLRSWAQVADLV